MGGQLDRRKYAFDLLEHVLGGVHATGDDEVCGLVTAEVYRPPAIVDADYEVAIELEHRRRPR